MSNHDSDPCLLDVSSMDSFTAIRAHDARRYGATVKALSFQIGNTSVDFIDSERKTT
jgi:hypothetical protein